MKNYAKYLPFNLGNKFDFWDIEGVDNGGWTDNDNGGGWANNVEGWGNSNGESEGTIILLWPHSFHVTMVSVLVHSVQIGHNEGDSIGEQIICNGDEVRDIVGEVEVEDVERFRCCNCICSSDCSCCNCSNVWCCSAVFVIIEIDLSIYACCKNNSTSFTSS